MEQTIKDIKKEFRANMNGIASQYMRQRGANYHVVFGIELPRIKEIAREFTPNHQLAQSLWHENVRESKILAPLLMPLSGFDREMADIWVDDIQCVEIAQMTVMNLFSQLPFASDLAFEWAASERPMRRLCGFLLMARFLQQGATMNERAEAEFLDQAEAVVRESLDETDTSERSVVLHALKRATMNALNFYAEKGENEAARVEKIVENAR